MKQREIARPVDEQDLVTRARAGDGEAIEALIRHFQNRVFSLALRLTRNRTEAEDVVQETFVRALEALPTFRGEAGFFTWLYRITLNLVRDRSRAASGAAAPAANWLEIDPPTPEPSPEDRLEGRQAWQRIEVALGRLEPMYREAFLLRHVEGLSYEAMATILDAPIGTLKMRAHRACTKLKTLLEADDEE